MFVILATGFSAAATAPNIYIAQNAAGGNTGADCADAHAVSWFNSSANWGSNAAQIGPGTTVHLCGTFNAPAGANGYLSFQGGGNSGSPVTLLFESGAVLTAPYWGGDGAIFADGVSYITVDGGANGVVQATANGTALANQAGTYAVYMQGVSNSEVKDLTISNIYVHTADQSDEGGQNSVGLQWSYGSNVTIDNNTCHDVRSCIIYSYQGSSTSSNINIFSNTVYNVNWGIIVGDGNGGAILNAPVAIHDNTIHDFALWDDNANYNHHDGVYCFSTHPTSSLNACSVYNNYIYGDPGTHTNTYIFFSENDSGMACSGMQAFNNLLVNSAGSTGRVPANGFVQDWCTNTIVYNNTMVGFSASDTTGGNMCIALNVGTGLTTKNNICSTVNLGIYLNNGGSVQLKASDYNNPYVPSYVGSNNVGNYFGTLLNWQTCITDGCPLVHDMNSTNGNPSLTSSYHLSSSASAAWQKGANLSSICNGQANPGLGALCLDKAGVQRPSTGNWDIGAYEDSAAGGTAPSPPSGLAAVVQ
jgi:hypothetical protein